MLSWNCIVPGGYSKPIALSRSRKPPVFLNLRKTGGFLCFLWASKLPKCKIHACFFRTSRFGRIKRHFACKPPLRQAQQHAAASGQGYSPAASNPSPCLPMFVASAAPCLFMRNPLRTTGSLPPHFYCPACPARSSSTLSGIDPLMIFRALPGMKRLIMCKSPVLPT